MSDLGAVDSDRFRLLVDENHDAFRAFGCLESDDPKHGIFLIDRNGVICSSYIGNSPFGDTALMMSELRKLNKSKVTR